MQQLSHENGSPDSLKCKVSEIFHLCRGGGGLIEIKAQQEHENLFPTSAAVERSSDRFYSARSVGLLPGDVIRVVFNIKPA